MFPCYYIVNMDSELTRRLKEQNQIRWEVIWRHWDRRPSLGLKDMIIELEKRVSDLEKKFLK